MPVTISETFSGAGGDQGDFWTDGEAALKHVLAEVLSQPSDRPLTKALERSGFNKIYDVLLLNQAERNTLTFLDANGVITPLPIGLKNLLRSIKLFSCHSENQGKPILDWTKVTRADFNKFRSSPACFEATERATIPPSGKISPPSYANATVPRKVAVLPVPSIPKTSSVVRSQSFEDSGERIAELQYVLTAILSEALDGPLAKALKNHGLTAISDILLLNQAERNALHFLKADGTFSTLPIGPKNRLLAIKLFEQHCKDKGKPIADWRDVKRDEFNEFRSSEACNHAAERLTVHPSIKDGTTTALATALTDNVIVAADLQSFNACPSFAKGKEGIEVFSSTAETPKQSTIFGCHVQHVKPVKQLEILHDFLFLFKIDQGSFGISCGVNDYHPPPAMNYFSWTLDLPSTLAELSAQDFKKEPPDYHVGLLCSMSPFIPSILQDLNFGRITGSQVALYASHDADSLPDLPSPLDQLVFYKMTAGNTQKLSTYTSDDREIPGSCNGEAPGDVPVLAHMFSTSNGESTDATPYLAIQACSSDNDLIAGDLKASQTFEQLQVPLESILHEPFDMENVTVDFDEDSYAGLFPMKIAGNNAKHKDCALPTTGTIVKLDIPSTLALIALDIKISGRLAPKIVYLHELVSLKSFGKHMSVDSTGGELSSAGNSYHVDSIDGELPLIGNGCYDLVKHTGLANIQFDPGGLLKISFKSLPSGETNGHQHPLCLYHSCPIRAYFGSSSFKVFIPTTGCMLFYIMHGGEQSMIYYLLSVSCMCVVADLFGQLNFRQKGSDNFYTGLGPCGLSVKSGFVLMSFPNDHQGYLTIGCLAETNVNGVFGAYFPGFGVYSRLWQFSSHTLWPSSHYYGTTGHYYGTMQYYYGSAGYNNFSRLIQLFLVLKSTWGTQATRVFVHGCTGYVPVLPRYSCLRIPRRNFLPYHGYMNIRTRLYRLRTSPTTVLMST